MIKGSAMFTITAMDHIVINVRDMKKALQFYTDVLGLPGERIEEFGQGKVGFPSVRINADTLIDLFPMSESEGQDVSAANMNHFCMVINPSDMPAVIKRLEANGVEIDEGPVPRWGAHGNGTSIYFNDPEGNRIEIRYYDA